MTSNEEIVRRAHEALNRGDIDGLIALCDREFRLDMSDRVLNPAVYDGHEGIRRFHAEVMEIWETFTWKPLEIHEHEHRIVAVVRARGRGRGSAVELDRRSAMVWQVEGGLAQSLRFYREPAEALAAVRGTTE